jgi:two-component system phosphate regulon sensor histidine kinase PhoR
MRVRILWKLFAAFTFLSVITAIFLTSFLVVRLRSDVEKKISQRLESNAVLAGETFRKDFHEGDIPGIQNRAKTLASELHLRITVIDKQGKVVADSERDPASMENHGNRVEFTEAVEKGVGESTRLSGTLNFPMKYVAVRITDDSDIIGVVRIAVPLSEVQLELRPLYRAAILGAVVAICAAAIIAYLMAHNISWPIRRMKRIAERISKGDFGEKIIIKGNNELAELAESLNTMANELQVKMERMKHMDRVRSDFVANVSHELKTPLTAIRGFVETLEDGAINDKTNATRFLAIIKKHTQRLGNIIDDLLRLSELESGGRIEMAELDLKGLVDEVVMGFGHSLNAKRQELSVEAEGGDFVTLGDRAKLEQVFVNLIDNAIKYTKEGGQIKVRLAADGDCLTVAVEDNGIGIPKDDVERVFERFYRVDKAHSRKVGGTGLGLSIAKHIVLVHNGQIRIESEPGRGTKVIVTLARR